MKVFVYLLVFCLLFFLLVLSFDEGRNTQDVSEWDQVAAEFETNVSEAGRTMSDTSARMAEQNEITEAQEQGTTALDLLKSSSVAMMDEFKNNLSGLLSAWGAKTKEAAYVIAYDISELLYPTRRNKNRQTTPVLSVKQARAMPVDNAKQQVNVTIKPAVQDKTIPVPATMAGNQTVQLK